MTLILLAALAIALYVCAAVMLGRRLLRAAPEERLPRAVPLTAATAGLALHGAVLFRTLAADGGIDLGVFNAASLAAWAVVAVLVVVSLLRPTENLGVVVLPLAALALLAGLLSPVHRTVSPEGHWALDVHIAVSLAAYAVLTMAALQSLVLAFQDHHLRTHRPGGILRALPPLQTMEDLLFQLIGTGFALLSVALLTGFFFVEDLFAQHLVHKTVLALVSWAVFGGLLAGRSLFGWRGRTAIRWTLTGFVALALAYFGTKLVLELVLGRTG